MRLEEEEEKEEEKEEEEKEEEEKEEEEKEEEKKEEEKKEEEEKEELLSCSFIEITKFQPSTDKQKHKYISTTVHATTNRLYHLFSSNTC